MPQQPHLMDLDPEESLSDEELAKKKKYQQRLAEALKDPEFRKIEGFPIGEDEAILALSDPPYYTACPNPFLGEIIEEWQRERAEIRKDFNLQHNGNSYLREPFSADVSEGKTNPIYRAHAYHTKVPHPAIMRYILHYTDPGDVIFDGFCGTGMTGVAAQFCGIRTEVEKLGYFIDEDGLIFEKPGAIEPISRIGNRYVILNDLSPIATFIAYNYNTPLNVNVFEREAKQILKEVKDELGWMYETWHPNVDDPNRIKVNINYTVWSEILSCPSCSQEIVFYREAFDKEIGRVKQEFTCPHCGITIQKKDLELLFNSQFDPITETVLKRPRRVPVLINYTTNKTKYEKQPDRYDLEIIEKIQALNSPAEIPNLKLPDMQMARVGRMKTTNVSHIHHFFLPRQAHSLAELWRFANQQENPRIKRFLLFFIEQAISGMSILNRYQPVQHGRLGGSQVNRAMSGVFYAASQISEVSPWYNLDGKLKRLVKAFKEKAKAEICSVITTENLGTLDVVENSIDYIFTDPPFGENIYYSDLNILIESWHKVLSAPKHEVIVDRVRKKTFIDYERMMETCFGNYYKSLKPGRWMTVEFHNSKNRVWNAIQQAILNSGFIIADVRVLDKKQRSFQQAMSANAVKQDLVISAYKPTEEFQVQIQSKIGTLEGVWAFIRQHLNQLPIIVKRNGSLEPLRERQDHLLFDRMIAFHIQRGVTVPLSATQFLAGLVERFPKRDSMYFLSDQVAKYDRARLEADNIAQLTLFVNDEKTAIQWLRQQIDPDFGGEPQTYQVIQPKFLQQLHQAKHELLPELSELLDQNFLEDNLGKWYVPNPSKVSDLEKIRNKALLREFNQYLEGKKKIKQFRTEAVRAGFADAWQRKDFATIIKVAERLPKTIIHEDPDLLMYYDNASLRVD